MVEDDIYGSKVKFERFMADLNNRVGCISRVSRRGRSAKYFCKNPANAKYFFKLESMFKAKDISFVRRLRIMQSMMLLSYVLEADFSVATRGEFDVAVGRMHEVYGSAKSKVTFVQDVKFIWRLLFPDVDEKGRPDDTIVPYVVRHISAKVDKSRQKMRKDKLSVKEFESLVDYFSGDARMQAYLTISLESLTRPQELLYVRIGNIELFDNYAKLFITEHGKEGTGLLQCIDSYPYLQKWLGLHPQKNDKNAFLFVNVGNVNFLKQMKPSAVNVLIRRACRVLGIDKPITCYSLKRNGVTMRRLRGDSDMEIQHAARWTSTKQLKTYDLSNQEEALTRELEKRGLVATSSKVNALAAKKCEFCSAVAGATETFCSHCKRPLDRKAIVEESRKKELQIQELQQQIAALSLQFMTSKQELIQEVTSRILRAQSG